MKSGNEVNVGNAFNFITSPEFVMGTSGAFVGGLIVQKTMASGFGKIMMHSVMNVIPGGPFVKSVVNVLPYTLGAMVGSDLLTGNLGQRGIGETLASGIGSSVGMDARLRPFSSGGVNCWSCPRWNDSRFFV